MLALAVLCGAAVGGVPFTDAPDGDLDEPLFLTEPSYDDSPDFPLDTRLFFPESSFADSPDFPIDTRSFLADNSFADSADFILDTRSFLAEESFGTSPTFALSLSGINRAWGDSETFGINTLPPPGIVSIDRWWAYVADPPFTVNLEIDVRDAGDYAFRVDLPPTGGWALVPGAFVAADNAVGDEFDLLNTASLGALSAGRHVLHVQGLQALAQSNIGEMTFHLCGSVVSCWTVLPTDSFKAMFIADRRGLESVSGLSFEDGQGGGLSIGSVQALADAFAPILFFDSGENYFPQSVETTLAGDNTRVLDGTGALLEDSVDVVSLHAVARGFGSDASLESLWIDLPGTAPLLLGTINGNDPFKLYATVIRESDEIAISYYIHYGYSNWAQHGGYNSHEGDWESAFVFLRSVTPGGSLFRPHRVAYSQHEKLVAREAPAFGGGEWALWSELADAGLVTSWPGGSETHPRLFVGLGGHASYFVSGDTDWPVPCPPIGSYEERHHGDHGQPRRQDQGVTMLRRAPLAVVEEQAWLVFPGRWGQDDLPGSAFCGNRGPLGPVYATASHVGGVPGQRWFNPVGWVTQGLEFTQIHPASAPVVSAAVIAKFCDLNLNLDGPVTSEPRQGGVNGLRIAFSPAPNGPGSTPVTIFQKVCPAPGSYVPYTGAATVSAVVQGNELVLSFTPGLENGRTYRIVFGPEVTSLGGQFVEVRALLGDVNSDGRANSNDRSGVVGVWTGSGYSCATDLNNGGRTNANDRSIVIGAWTGPQNCAP